MDPELKPIISVILSSLLLIIISIPLIVNKIPPNCLYGFRLRKTLSDKGIWYKANRYGGTCLVMSGLIALIGCIVLLLYKDKLSFGMINGLSLELLIIPVIVSLILTLVYIKRL
nr:SdpI family protein [Candidatus Omnitrophota bacterium]